MSGDQGDNSNANSNSNDKQYIPREHYLNVVDTVELKKAIILLQNPLDDGERLKTEDLQDWSIVELQVAATIQSNVYWGNQQIIPQFFGKVLRPTEKDIANLRTYWTNEMQRRSKAYLDKMKRGDNNPSNKNKEKEKDSGDMVTTEIKTDLDLDLDDLDETESEIASRITGVNISKKRTRFRMENSVDNVDMGTNSTSISNKNKNDKSKGGNVKGKNGFNSHGVKIGNMRSFTFSNKNNGKNNSGDLNQQQINAARAKSLLLAQKQIIQGGKFTQYRVYKGKNGVETYFACHGDQLISTAGRPDGYDTDDDVFTEDFKADLNHRPFFEFWSIVNEKNANKGGRV